MKKRWSQKRYENEVKSIIKDCWEPMTDLCKESIKLVDGYSTLDGFENAVNEGLLELIARERVLFKRCFDSEEARTLDMVNASKILSFIQSYREELAEYGQTFKENPMVLDDDDDDAEPVGASTTEEHPKKSLKPCTMVIDED